MKDNEPDILILSKNPDTGKSEMPPLGMIYTKEAEKPKSKLFGWLLLIGIVVVLAWMWGK